MRGDVISDVEYATGEAKSQNCTTNGMTYRTSRYRTFNAEAHKPTANAVSSESITNTGNSTLACAGLMPHHAINPSRITKEIPKSTSVDATDAIGTTRRG